MKDKTNISENDQKITASRIPKFSLRMTMNELLINNDLVLIYGK